jgi:hypothetical protein
MTTLRSRLRGRWRAFKALPAGTRFQRFHEQQKDAPTWVKLLLIVGALASIAAGVILTFVPGPAFVFFGLAGAMLATQSVHVARLLDRAELAARALMVRARATWASRRRRTSSGDAVKTLPPPRVVGR